MNIELFKSKALEWGFGIMLKMRFPLKKLKRVNKKLAQRAFEKGEIILKNLPVNGLLSPIANCNYRCLFCEIHKDDVVNERRFRNELGIDEINQLEPLFRGLSRLAFYGGSEEPLLNRNFGAICAYLKKKYGFKMYVTTNGSLLKEELAKTLVEIGFDQIQLSYHAGTAENYKFLMTGRAETVDKNIKTLNKIKGERKSLAPELTVHFALQKLNSEDATKMLDKAKEFKAKSVYINHYHGGRNRLNDKKVAYDYDPENGNEVLDEIYKHGENIGQKLHPEKPKYWDCQKISCQWDPANFDAEIACEQPWKTLQLKPVPGEPNKLLLSVCNRIELMKVDYKKIPANGEVIGELWNHPVLQYLRKTVNAKNPNAICQYCKNRNREKIRNVDEDEYARIRDHAIKKFFSEARQNGGAYIEKDWFEILTENPQQDEVYKEKLNSLKTIEVQKNE